MIRNEEESPAQVESTRTVFFFHLTASGFVSEHEWASWRHGVRIELSSCALVHTHSLCPDNHPKLSPLPTNLQYIRSSLPLSKMKMWSPCLKNEDGKSRAINQAWVSYKQRTLCDCTGCISWNQPWLCDLTNAGLKKKLHRFYCNRTSQSLLYINVHGEPSRGTYTIGPNTVN